MYSFMFSGKLSNAMNHAQHPAHDKQGRKKAMQEIYHRVILVIDAQNTDRQENHSCAQVEFSKLAVTKESCRKGRGSYQDEERLNRSFKELDHEGDVEIAQEQPQAEDNHSSNDMMLSHEFSFCYSSCYRLAQPDLRKSAGSCSDSHVVRASQARLCHSPAASIHAALRTAPARGAKSPPCRKSHGILRQYRCSNIEAHHLVADRTMWGSCRIEDRKPHGAMLRADVLTGR
jgi:hypothetical protein